MQAEKATDHAAAGENLIDSPPGELPEGHVVDTGFFFQFRFMWKAFMHTPTRNTLLLTFLGIFILLCLITRGQLAINDWMNNYWNAISTVNLPEFIRQLGIFLVLISIMLVFNVSQTYLNEFFKMKLREGLTDDLINQWLMPKRAYRLSLAGEIGINPDQRLHEDARHLAESTASLCISLLQSVMMLFAFSSVLWQTSAGFVFNVSGHSFPLPGYMVWAVILYAGLAAFLTWFFGRNLVGLNADRYAKEAELRTELMRVNQRIDSITLQRGERDETKRLKTKVAGVLAALWKLVLANTRLSIITQAYGWITIVAPVVIASPVYFGGGLTFGGLMAASDAFNKVHESLRWFVSNYGALADWRATMLRVTTFRQALLQMDDVDTTKPGRIEIGQNSDNCLTIDELVVRTANGYMLFEDQSIRVHEGKSLLIYSQEDVDASIVFNAITGMWPWGHGYIGMPARQEVMFLPKSPYFPEGIFRDAMLYPADGRSCSDETIREALDEAGLAKLASLLDREANWDRFFNDSEKQCLGFVRAVLKQPKWLIANQVFEGLEDVLRQKLEQMALNRLGGVTLIYVSRKDDYANVFDTTSGVIFVPLPTSEQQKLEEEETVQEGAEKNAPFGENLIEPDVHFAQLEPQLKVEPKVQPEPNKKAASAITSKLASAVIAVPDAEPVAMDGILIIKKS